MKTRLTYAMKNYLPWTLLALAVSYPLFGQGTLTKERILCLTPEQEEILSHMSIVYLDDGAGNLVNKAIRIEGVNLQIVNGLDATNGFPLDPDSVDPVDTVVNGVGNLIVGYNELGNPHPGGDNRTGSHNIVVGHGNSYNSFGGFVGPLDNTTSAPFASVTGGTWNRATGVSASVSGGRNNLASGPWASVGGGADNGATAYGASVSCGHRNWATGHWSSASGGLSNTASGHNSSVSGGSYNTASGRASSVSGGGGYYYSGGNLASGDSSSISGGRNNQADGYYASVSGGNGCRASGYASSVSGGANRSVSGAYNWRGGQYYSNN